MEKKHSDLAKVKMAKLNYPEPDENQSQLWGPADFALWRKLIRVRLPEDWNPADLQSLHHLVIAERLLQAAENNLLTGSATYTDRKGIERVSPHFLIANRLNAQITAINRRLSLSRLAVHVGSMNQRAKDAVQIEAAMAEDATNGLLAGPY